VIFSLRMDPRTAGIPILVLSANPGRLGNEHEVDAVLAKPVRPAALMEAVARLAGSANAIATS
jgi:CheY-like chemotaxis protein